MNNLQKILCVGAGVLALGLTGCSRDYLQYEYNGQIGEELVKFESKDDLGLFCENTLTVVKADGKVITYMDYIFGDLKLEELQIIDNGRKIIYTDNFSGIKKINEAQKEFDNYLGSILKIKKEEGLDFLVQNKIKN